MIRQLYDGSNSAPKIYGNLIAAGSGLDRSSAYLLFAITIEWIFRRTTGSSIGRIIWTDGTRLFDLDFADIALIGAKQRQL